MLLDFLKFSDFGHSSPTLAIRVFKKTEIDVRSLLILLFKLLTKKIETYIFGYRRVVSSISWTFVAFYSTVLPGKFGNIIVIVIYQVSGI